MLDAEQARARLQLARGPRRDPPAATPAASSIPAKLCHGLAKAAEGLGAVIYETSPVVGLDRAGTGVVVRTSGGAVRCDHVVLATNAYSGAVLRPDPTALRPGL